ncbi:MAG: TonB-dependent receptor [Bacteroidota bacterium]
MKAVLRFYVLFLMLFIAGFALAQDRTVTGTVTSSDDGLPIPGVNVVLEGTTTGSATDLDGNYKVSVTGENPVLVFSFIGYATQSITVGSQSVIDISLELDTKALEEVVVVGYGTQKKANLTGAVASVDVAKTLEAKPVADVSRSLQGVVAGLTVLFPSGNLNQEPNIKLRGYGSSSGSNEPLVLIDGVQGRLSDINPEAIANISVLKDAASASIYGARGAFGVILVTTKEGKEGKTTVNYSNNFSFNKPMWDIQHAHMDRLMDAIHVARDRNNGGAPFAFGMGGQDWREKSEAWEREYGYLGSSMTDEVMVMDRDFEVIDDQFYSYRSWDVFDQLLNDKGMTQTQNLSVGGGSDKLKFNLSYGYTSRDGIYKVNTETLDRHTVNGTVSAKLADWVTLKFNTMYTKKIYEEPFNYRSGTLGYLFYATRWPNNFPYGVSDGTYFGAPEGSSFRSPIGYLRVANRNRLERDYIRQTIGAEFDVLTKETHDLNISTNLTYAFYNEVYHVKGGSVPIINWWSQGNVPFFDPIDYATSDSRNRTSYSSRNNKLKTFNAYATYTNTSFADHTFKLIGGTNIESNQYLSIYANHPFLFDPGTPELGLATGDLDASSDISEWSLLGFFGRVNYNYKEKLLLELNGRLDGSSRFPGGDKYAFFPSASAGYRISEESFAGFLESAKINNLKIRASWGEIGYQEVPLDAYIPTMSDYESYWIVNSIRETTFSNPRAFSSSLTWETVETIDLGVDMGFLDNRIELIFDWYTRTTKGILGPGEIVPDVFGATPPQVNSGEMQTKGWELTLNARHRFNDNLEIFGSAVLSDAIAKITKWENPTGILTDFYKGKVLGEIWGFRTDRLFQENDFINIGGEEQLIPGTPIQDPNMYSSGFNLGPGDVKYVDLNGDGLINKGAYTLDDHGDLEVIGNMTPKYEYSFRGGANFKGFDLNFLLQGVGKRDYWAMGNLALANYHYDVLYEHQEDYWREDNIDAFYPRPFVSNDLYYLSSQRNIGQLARAQYTITRGVNNYVPQTRYLQNLAYLRLKELTVGYSFPKAIIDRINIQKLRVYFSGYNIIEWSGSFIPVDPESTPNSSGSFPYYGNSLPQSRSFSFGLQVTL